MSLASRRIGDLVIKLQDCFLTNPEVALSPWQVEQLCGVDELTCRAILNLLVDGGVIARTNDGRFIRRLPSAMRPASSRRTIARAHLVHIRPALAG